VTKVTGTQELIRKLQRINQVAVGVVAEKQLQDLLVRRVKGRFDEGVSPDGSPWAGLMEATVSRKRRKGSPRPDALLQDTRKLRNSIGVISGGNTNLLASSTGLGFRIGVRDPLAARYGRLHNFGMGGQEKRQFLGIGASDVRSVRDFISRRLQSIAGA
jgi:phage gpG-like protein